MAGDSYLCSLPRKDLEVLFLDNGADREVDASVEMDASSAIVDSSCV